VPSENVKIRELHVQQFRNHAQTDAVFTGGINAVLGDNGEGKTNLLEAISYLCLTKSFFGSTDGTVLRVGSTRFQVSGELEADAGIRYHVAVAYDHVEGSKNFSINKSPVEKFAQVVGQFPIVILSPESGAITTGGPADRRRFLDFVISQASKLYLEDLLEYRRVLRQRNRVLFDARAGRANGADVLEPWDQELVDRGVRITNRRKKFVEEFQPFVHEAYGRIAGGVEKPAISYCPSVSAGEEAAEEELRTLFFQELKRKAQEERRLGLTLVGPHRDELELTINTLGVRSHASQGQHKTFLIALKIAEFLYLQKMRDERPILLLDDIFTELDNHRSERLLELTQSVGQAFVTATSVSVFPRDFDWAGTNKRFFVHKGTVGHEKAASLAY
jgi:DNA replication and repair protein RecF